MEGYQHPLYAQSFYEIGEPLFLPRSNGWFIKRQIPGTPYFDAMGPYPMFFCDDWDALIGDLQQLKGDLISISMVIGPFEELPNNEYSDFFDIFKPYKNHYILDTNVPIAQAVSKWSLKDARRALKEVSIDLVTAPDINLDEWVTLYDNLVKRHDIKGIRAFSRESFAKQITIPNTHFFRAWRKGELVGGNLYYIQQNVAYGHLLALTDEGYRLGASHAIKWVAIQNLAKMVKWINFGGSTGNDQGSLTGLDKFKMGWTNDVKRSHFCAKVLDQVKYDELTSNKAVVTPEWFPAYRSGEY